MNIAVIHPHSSKTGATTVTLLTALELGRHGKKCCITHTKSGEDSIDKYLGFKEEFEDDKTSNSSRLVKMINEGGMTPEELHNYCKEAIPNVEVYTADDTIDESGLESTVKFMCESQEFDYLLIDVDNDYTLKKNKVAKISVEKADLVILVLDQNGKSLEKFKNNSKRYMADLAGKPMLVVVNKFTDIAGSIKSTAALLGIKKPNNWIPVRYNSWLIWACNNNGIRDLAECMADEHDMRVADIEADITNVANSILKVKIAARKESIEGKKRK